VIFKATIEGDAVRLPIRTDNATLSQGRVICRDRKSYLAYKMATT